MKNYVPNFQEFLNEKYTTEQYLDFDVLKNGTTTEQKYFKQLQKALPDVDPTKVQSHEFMRDYFAGDYGSVPSYEKMHDRILKQGILMTVPYEIKKVTGMPMPKDIDIYVNKKGEFFINEDPDDGIHSWMFNHFEPINKKSINQEIAQIIEDMYLDYKKSPYYV